MKSSLIYFAFSLAPLASLLHNIPLHTFACSAVHASTDQMILRSFWAEYLLEHTSSLLKVCFNSANTVQAKMYEYIFIQSLN
ncbi:hypothetical protein EDC01DRAFT_648896 [Geopyxis carbonaria]|nr:hypothetical protein EDC01DRAFT_648896 [Geopyxis carbonaria]